MIILKPQDVVVLLKLSVDEEVRTLATLGAELGISASEVHGALNRASAAALLDLDHRRPRPRALLEFLEHGIRYVFVSRRGEITRGLPTAHSAPPLNTHLSTSKPVGNLEQVYARKYGLRDRDGLLARMVAEMSNLVWPHPAGTVRGESLEPLYPSVVSAAMRDASLYECLALVDAIRVGQARERTLAVQLLRERILRS